MRICIQYHGHIIALLAIVQAAITKYGQVLITAGVERRNSSILTHMSYSAGPSLQIDVFVQAASNSSWLIGKPGEGVGVCSPSVEVEDSKQSSSASLV